MAVWRNTMLPFIITRVFYTINNKHVLHVTARGLALRPALRSIVPYSQQSRSSSSSSSSSSGDVEISVTRDGETIVCFHQAPDISYDLTQPVPRPHKPLNSTETHHLLLQSQLQKTPSVEELAKMFFTTKHRWYPVGEFHKRRRNQTPPKDR